MFTGYTDSPDWGLAGRLRFKEARAPGCRLGCRLRRPRAPSLSPCAEAVMKTLPILFLLILAAPAAAGEIVGPARVIDGDTIEPGFPIYIAIFVTF